MRINNNILWWISACLAIVLIFTPFQFISFGIIIVLLSFLLPFSKKSWINLPFSYLIISMSIMCIAAITWLTRIPLHNEWLFLLLIFFICVYRRTRTTTDSKLFTAKHTLVAYAVASVVLLLCISPILIHPNRAYVLRYSVQNRDETSHAQMVLANYNNNKYIYANPDATEIHIEKRLTGYPQGWHTNGAVLYKSIVKFNSGKSIFIFLSTYMAFKAMWLFTCVYLLTLLFILLLKITVNKTYLSLLYATICMVFAGTILLAPLYFYGFQTYIAAATIVCFQAICLIFFRRTKRNVFYYLSLLSIPASSMAWLIALPVTAAMEVFELGIEKLIFKLKFFGPLLISLVFCTFQPIIQLMFAAGPSGLNEDGAIPPLNVVGVVIIWLVYLFIILFREKRNEDEAHSNVILFAPLPLLTLSIFLFQKVTIGSATYYTLKVTHLSLVFIFILVMSYLSTILESKKIFISAITTSSILLSIPVILNLNIGLSFFGLRDRSVISTVAAKELLTNQTNTLPNKNDSSESSTEEAYLFNRIQFIKSKL